MNDRITFGRSFGEACRTTESAKNTQFFMIRWFGRLHCFGRFWPKLRPKLRFRSYTNFGETRVSKTAIFALFGALNFCLSLLKIQKVVKIQIHSPLMWKMAQSTPSPATCAKWTFSEPKKLQKTAVLELLHSQKLISRKIWKTEKSCNFHSVNLWVFRYLGWVGNTEKLIRGKDVMQYFQFESCVKLNDKGLR